MNLGLSFLRGMVAAVNPCAFVLLPTYLVYFLGVEATEMAGDVDGHGPARRPVAGEPQAAGDRVRVGIERQDELPGLRAAPDPEVHAVTPGHPAEVEIEPLAGSERHMAWISNSFLLDIVDKELLARHFDWTHRVASQVPTFRLDYPRDYGMLVQVRDAVREHVKRLGD